MQMAVQDAVTQIGADVKASVDEAAVAFDGLVDELKLAAPNANTVLSLSGQIWVASTQGVGQPRARAGQDRGRHHGRELTLSFSLPLEQTTPVTEAVENGVDEGIQAINDISGHVQRAISLATTSWDGATTT